MKSKQRVVVVIPTHTFALKEYEEEAVQNCYEQLKAYDIVVVHPERIAHQREGVFKDCKKIALPDTWFQDVKQYNKLKTSKFFYNYFRNYDFMLTHEPDAWVFRDELEFWCDKGYDYIGAPWFQVFENPPSGTPFMGVGNSGFSLRNVQSCLKVLNEIQYPNADWNSGTIAAFLKKRVQKVYLSLNKEENCFVQNFYHSNEDFFWGLEVPKFCSWYRIAPVEVALKFSFEVAPERLWSMNNYQLPFGCHAWHKYSPEFWSQFIP